MEHADGSDGETSQLDATPSTPECVTRLARALAGDTGSQSSSDSDSTSESGQSAQVGAVVPAGGITSELPDGENTFEAIYRWPQIFAKTLLTECQDAQIHQKNLRAMMCHGIIHHDAFSGLGTASITAKTQLDFLDMELRSSPNEGLLRVKACGNCKLSIIFRQDLYSSWDSAGPAASGSTYCVPVYACVTSCDNDSSSQKVLRRLCQDRFLKCHVCKFDGD